MPNYREDLNLKGGVTVAGYLEGLGAAGIPAIARHEPDGSWTVFIFDEMDIA